jgi:hypothetical protein
MSQACINRFLWVEDFNTAVVATAKAVLGGIIEEQILAGQSTKYRLQRFLKEKEHGVVLQLDFTSAMRFIRNQEQFAQIDYVLLDINLPVQEDDDEPLDDLAEILKHYKDVTELQEQAGYQLYIELVVHQGFPKEKILFCSDHGKELASITKAFDDAKIPLAHPIYEKTKTKEIQGWLAERCTPRTDYDILRKGVSEGCRSALALIEKDTQNIQFGEFIKGADAADLQPEMRDYLKTLQSLLPAREPSDKKYKLFIRTLTHEWEDKAEPDNVKKDRWKYTCGQIMKCARNWTTHTNQFNNLTEEQLAFFFLIAMRAMFKLPEQTQNYELLLLQLYQGGNLPDKTTIAQFLSASYAATLNTYAKVLGGKGKLEPVNMDKINFISLLKTMQWHDKENKENFNYIRGLLQIFWHGLSPITLRKPQYHQDSAKLHFECEYSFDLHDYGRSQPDSFIYALARAIYHDNSYLS